jgi:hypothetical protein
MTFNIGLPAPHSDPPRRRAEVRCNGCRAWFPNDLRECPECHHPRPGFNKRLRTAILDNHLLSQARDADLSL